MIDLAMITYVILFSRIDAYQTFTLINTQYINRIKLIE